eukprot:TRINITY_DN432_c0_g1_i3.p1 TRINITY_DN432_c0_g1~~TRINITY_DN432_c0_g1_i3.p1  ORF type:complete len:481 (+),score=73.03 TRINITY_DN432_c0_g1_i3:143-1585(+)
MAGGGLPDTYSWWTAFIYIYNLIVGVGVLTLPHAFQQAGLVLSTAFLAFIASLGFITATWVVEAQALANYLLPEIENDRLSPGDSSVNPAGDIHTHGDAYRILKEDGRGVVDLPAEEYQNDTKARFHLDTRLELGHMAEILLGYWGEKLFYLILVMYLYGDLAVYATFVPLSVVDVTGALPWTIHGYNLSSDQTYRLYVIVFALFTVPFTFFNFQKTKWLQIFTMITRNLAFIAMVILGITYIAENGFAPVKLVDFTSFPTLFGATIYSFMCHHSIPGFVTPIDTKKKIPFLFLLDFVTIFSSYIFLTYSANFAYGGKCIESTYTTNWRVNGFSSPFLGNVLALFPLVTVISNFPLIGITLRNNLMKLCPIGEEMQQLRQIVFALVSVLPPLAIAFADIDLTLIVTITGSYPGLCVMFLVPMLLVFFGRRKVTKHHGDIRSNPFASPFHQIGWIILISVWVVSAAVIVGYSLFTKSPATC